MALMTWAKVAQGCAVKNAIPRGIQEARSRSTVDREKLTLKSTSPAKHICNFFKAAESARARLSAPSQKHPEAKNRKIDTEIRAPWSQS